MKNRLPKQFILLLALLPTAIFAAEDCLDFEEFPLNATYANGQTLVEDGLVMTIGDYTNSNGVTVTTGQGRIVAGGAGTTGQAIFLSNASLSPNLPCALTVQLDYVNHGGRIEIIVNGSTHFIGSPTTGTFSLGGVDVQITASDFGGDFGGTITFTAGTQPINSMSVGGQELDLDSICWSACNSPDCYDFEGLDGKKLFPGDTYTEDGSTLTVAPYITARGDALDGFLTQNGSPLGLHQGNEALLTEASISVVGDCFASLKVSYREQKDGVNLEINGVLVKGDNFKAFAGTTVGGVSVSADGEVLVLDGIIESVVIGGVQLVLDHLCYEKCPMDCIDFEEVAPGLFGAGLTEDNVVMSVSPFAPGPVPTFFRIGTQQGAGHSGQDAALENVRLEFGIPCAEEITLHFGEYTAGVGLVINGESVTVTHVLNFDGTDIGGVAVAVEQTPVTGGFIGTIRISGGADIESFSIAGLDLVIDHVCYIPCEGSICLDFEELPANAAYQIEGVEGFAEDGVAVKITEYCSSPSSCTIKGISRVRRDRKAGHLGQDLELASSALSFDLGCVENLSLHFGEYAINSNLAINGDRRIVKSLGDLDGVTVGGVGITVTTTAVPGGVLGVIKFDGTVQNLVIGGDSLWIDHLCFDPCPTVDVGRLRQFTMLSESSTHWRMNFEVTVNAPAGAVKVVQTSADLGMTSPWATQAATFTPHPTKADTYNVSALLPKSGKTGFIRVRASLP